MPEPAATTTTPDSAQSSADDSAIFARFTEQHQAAVASEIEKEAHADSPQDVHRQHRSVAATAAGAAADAATGREPGGTDTGREREPGSAERAPDDASAAARSAKDGADGQAPAQEGLSEADAVALARKARDEGDTEGLDRALKAIFPGSKGLAEFNVDGKRYGEFRAASNKRSKKLDERESGLVTREQNLERGMSTLTQVVRRLEPIEQLVVAARDESPEGVAKFVELLEKATNKPLNETLKRHLNHKLDAKAGDPEVEALRRELKAEREARVERERKEQEARDQQARTQAIQGHLGFLHQTLSKHADGRVRALVESREGIGAIFRAQQAHYNAQTGATISPERAAQLVLDEAAKKLEPWRAVLGGGAAPAPATPPTSAAPPAAPDRARSLGSRGAAPASGTGGRKLTDTELFEKYERLAKVADD